MKTNALKIQDKLINDQALTYQDRTFLIGYIEFATAFQDFVTGNKNFNNFVYENNTQ